MIGTCNAVTGVPREREVRSADVVVYRLVLLEIARTDCLCDGAEPDCDGAPHLACRALGIDWPPPGSEQRRIAT